MLTTKFRPAFALRGRFLSSANAKSTSPPENPTPEAKSFVTKAVDKIKDFFLFNKDAEPFVNYANKSSMQGKGFRYPSPGSRGEASVPEFESKEDVYNIQYYTRDVRRNHPQQIHVISKGEEVALLGESSTAKSDASPGNKNPAVLRYDPSGTRSSMSTTQEGMNKLVEQHVGNHFPKPFWLSDGSETLVEEAKRKNIPPLPGRQSKWAYAVAIKG